MTNIVCAIAAAVIFLGDRVSKLWIMENIRLGECFWSVDGVMSFVYVQNDGAAFSILSGKLGFLTIISIVFCIGVLIYWIKAKPNNNLLKTALVLMTSGALGNAVDRMAYGYVVDFISADFIDFPVFNIADIAITVGAALIVLYAFMYDDKKKGEINDSEIDSTECGED